MNVSPAPLLPESVVSLPSFDFDKYERLLYQLRGKPVIVNIRASWCKPCRKEAPALAAAARRYGHAIQFLGVDIQDQRGPAAAFAVKLKLPYPSVFDETGDIHDALGCVGLPDTVFYDADGTIAATWSGSRRLSGLRSSGRMYDWNLAIRPEFSGADLVSGIFPAVPGNLDLHRYRTLEDVRFRVVSAEDDWVLAKGFRSLRPKATHRKTVDHNLALLESVLDHRGRESRERLHKLR